MVYLWIFNMFIPFILCRCFLAISPQVPNQHEIWTRYTQSSQVYWYDFSKSFIIFFRIYPWLSGSLYSWKAKGSFCLLVKWADSEQILALYGSRPILCTNACIIVYVAGDPPFIARRVNRVPLCSDWFHPLVSRFHNKNTFIKCFNSGPALHTVAQYQTNIVYLVWMVETFEML